MSARLVHQLNAHLRDEGNACLHARKRFRLRELLRDDLGLIRPSPSTVAYPSSGLFSDHRSAAGGLKFALATVTNARTSRLLRAPDVNLSCSSGSWAAQLHRPAARVWSS